MFLQLLPFIVQIVVVSRKKDKQTVCMVCLFAVMAMVFLGKQDLMVSNFYDTIVFFLFCQTS